MSQTATEKQEEKVGHPRPKLAIEQSVKEQTTCSIASGSPTSYHPASIPKPYMPRIQWPNTTL